MKEKWGVVFDYGENKYGVRFIRYEGETKGVDWTNYKIIEGQHIIYYTSEELLKFREELDAMLNSNQFRERECKNENK